MSKFIDIVKDSNFWFSQPPLILEKSDMIIAYIFVGFFLAGLLFWVISRFIKHSITKKLINKFFYLLTTLGPLGLVWFGLRYENTPILGKRIWVGLVLLIGLIWFLFVAKYFIFNYFSEKREYDKQSLINKYIPGNKNSTKR